MENKEKRKLMSLIYKTIFFISLIAIGTITYLSLDKIIYKTANNVQWLDIILLCYSFFLVIFMIADCVSTNKMTNKYNIAKFFYFLVVTTFLGAVTLCIYSYAIKVQLLNYSNYFLPLGLLIATEIFLLVNFVLGMTLSKLHRSTTVTIDSIAETPNFDDEISLKKKLDELNRKLEMKRVQEQIESVEKELDTK